MSIFMLAVHPNGEFVMQIKREEWDGAYTNAKADCSVHNVQ